MSTLSHPRFLRRACGAAAAASLLLMAAGCQGAAGGVAATVNGHEITQATLNDELNAIAANTDYVNAIQQSQTSTGQPQKVLGAGGKGTFDLQFTDLVLTREILLELVHAEVVKRHITLTAADLSAATNDTKSQLGQSQSGKDLFTEFPVSYRNLLVRRTAEVSALQKALGTVAVDNAAIQKYYDANKAQFTQTCVSHILVATQAQADQLRAQIVAGADFATVARQSSTDSGSAAKGGDLGCNAPGTFVAEFEAAETGLAVGQLSPVVHTQFGYHLIKVTDRKVQPLSAVHDQIVQALQSQGSSKLSAFIQAAATSAKVSVSPKFGSWRSSGQNPGVVPPNAPAPAAGGATTTSPPVASTLPTATTAPPDTGSGGAPATSTP